MGAPQTADLGDGNGFVDQNILLREDFGDVDFGTCAEQLIGGNHFRYVRNMCSLATPNQSSVPCSGCGGRTALSPTRVHSF